MTEVHEIFTHTQDNGVSGELGIDDKNNLYWNKKAIVTEQKIKLQWWVNCSVILASLSTVAIATFSALQFFGYGCSN